jgi:hypothetical protein
MEPKPKGQEAPTKHTSDVLRTTRPSAYVVADGLVNELRGGRTAPVEETTPAPVEPVVEPKGLDAFWTVQADAADIVDLLAAETKKRGEEQ